jgi:hypothetical protein
VEGKTRLGSTLLGFPKHPSVEEAGRLEIANPAFLRHLAFDTGTRAGITVSGIGRKARVLATVKGQPSIWAMPHGRGWAVVDASYSEEPPFENLVRDVTYNLSKLDPSKKDAMEVDTAPDGVYATLLADGEVILHNRNSTTVNKNVCGVAIQLPPHSLRSVCINPTP